MTEKVKLPKEVCDALDSITTYAEDSEIVHLVFTGACDTWDTQQLSQVTPNTIMRALVLGYEPEMTAEQEALKKLFNKSYFGLVQDKQVHQDAICETLSILGIQHEWLEGDAE